MNGWMEGERRVLNSIRKGCRASKVCRSRYQRVEFNGRRGEGVECTMMI